MDLLEWSNWAARYLTEVRKSRVCEFRAAIEENSGWDSSVPPGDWRRIPNRLLGLFLSITEDLVRDPNVPGVSFSTPAEFEAKVKEYKNFIENMRPDLARAMADARARFSDSHAMLTDGVSDVPFQVPDHIQIIFHLIRIMSEATDFVLSRKPTSETTLAAIQSPNSETVSRALPSEQQGRPLSDHHTSEKNSRKHYVILVHGIRDFALWHQAIKCSLEECGFIVRPTNYFYFDIFRFLIPVPYFRNRAIEKVLHQIRIVKELEKDKDKEISIIAHSFGSYLVSRIIEQGFEINFKRVIFCGSVVRYDFPFERYTSRFDEPILNEVGTRDSWPATAESVTWGYGSAGTYGFKRPLVHDRWHNKAKHGFFLTADFCKEFWVPFLKDGTIILHNREPEPTPFWIKLISILRIKYFLIFIAAAFLAAEAPKPFACGPSHVADEKRRIDGNITAGYYSSARSSALEMAECDKFYSLTALGEISFYERRYAEAVKMFEEALRVRETRDTHINLADSLVEVGSLRRALGIYETYDDNSPSAKYKLARTNLYLGNYEVALRYIRDVSDDFEEDGRPGKARILEAAAISGMISGNRGENAQVNADQVVFLMNRGFEMAPEYWRGILIGNFLERREGYAKTRELLQPYKERLGAR